MESRMDQKEVDDLIRDDRAKGLFRVNRRAFVDPKILEHERREIFDKCWLYAGHESEIKNPGDFVSRRVGGRPIFLVRDSSERIQAFLNTCPHRGNLVCREKAGSARVFSCFYHAWTFNLQGDLIGLPGEDAYTTGFEKKAMGLKSVPRYESYRGMIFVCYDKDAVDLRTYFGEETRKRLDYMLDFGGNDVEIVQGSQSYSMKANWKLLVENSIDAYHGMYTHQRYFRQYLPDIGMNNEKWVGSRAFDKTQGLALGNGHSVIESPAQPTPLDVSAKEELAEIRSELEDAFGKERASLMLDVHRNLFIFPNLILISLWRTVRTFYPVSPDYMEIDAWALMPGNESQELRQKRYENFISFLGPAGFGTPDDVSGLEGCQRGFATHRELPWSDISRGMGRDQPQAIDELQMRSFWRRWHALMQGEKGPTDCSDQPPERLAAAE
jgi:p-cumate 2,3-dioxygenase subunit alpha